MKKENSKSYPRVRAAIYGQPMAISKSGMDLICGIVEAQENGLVSNYVKAAGNPADPQELESDHLKMRGNTAVISVLGPIIPRANWFSQVSNLTSSTGILESIDEALSKDPEKIVFLFDSPGGSVSLGFEVADKIFSLRDLDIPVLSVVQGQCCSLAYLLASQTDYIYTGRDSMLGSISVILRAESSDRALRNEGTDINEFVTGNLKQAGDPSKMHFTDQYASVLEQAMTYHDMFEAAVARGRKAVDINKVCTGQVWIGQKAIDAGLADEISTLDDVLKNG
jgi:ClpP class serine protease